MSKHHISKKKMKGRRNDGGWYPSIKEPNKKQKWVEQEEGEI